MADETRAPTTFWVDIVASSADVRRWTGVIGTGLLITRRQVTNPKNDTGSSKVELVIFDCDGVLIDSELISAQTLIALLSSFGIEIDGTFVRQHFLGRSFPTVAGIVDEKFSVKLPDTFEKAYRKQLLVKFESDLTLMDGVSDVLDQLNVPFCLATSSSPDRTEKALRLTEIYDRFEGRIFTASEVANGKPAPDLFLHAAGRMNVAPERCLVIEDSLVGVQAGLAAGMSVIRFTGGSHLADMEAEPSNPAGGDVAQFTNFGALFDLVPDINAAKVTETYGK